MNLKSKFKRISKEKFAIVKNFFVINREIKKFLKNPNKIVIKEIELETINRCNGTCSFCPVNRNEKQRPYHKMSDQLFYKIINNLKEIGYKGKLSLFSNNEPFLDDRIVKFIQYAKKNLPNAKHALYSNGTLLTLDKFKKIINCLDYFHIDNYNNNLKVNENLKDVFKYIQNDEELKQKVCFDMRLNDEILTSRGGRLQTKKTASI